MLALTLILIQVVVLLTCVPEYAWSLELVLFLSIHGSNCPSQGMWHLTELLLHISWCMLYSGHILAVTCAKAVHS